MSISKLPVPEVYSESQDFRFFLQWMYASLSKIEYDTQNFYDLYDPLRCPNNLLWMLCDTVGYRLDDRLPISFNRLVLLYFMSMIRNKGSKDGVTLAAEVNLGQFNLLQKGRDKNILYDRLEDLNIPVNSAYVNANTSDGYIDVVYFSDSLPIDACIEYVRPVGMYCFQYAGVKLNSRTHISIDARLTNISDVGLSLGPTHVGHYRRSDYARIQQYENDELVPRNPVYYRNKKAEGDPDPEIDPGYRTLYSLQLCNNDDVVRSLIHSDVFELGYSPGDVSVDYNLLYDRTNELASGQGVTTIDIDRTQQSGKTTPAVNPPMMYVGDAMSLNSQNTQYTEADDQGNISVVDVDS